MEFNPLLINRFVRSKSLRKTKTDSIDALMIAQYLMTVEYKPYPPSFYTLEKLKSLTRSRDSLVRQRRCISFPIRFSGENLQHEFQVLRTIAASISRKILHGGFC